MCCDLEKGIGLITYGNYHQNPMAAGVPQTKQSFIAAKVNLFKKMSHYNT